MDGGYLTCSVMIQFLGHRFSVMVSRSADRGGIDGAGYPGQYN